MSTILRTDASRVAESVTEPMDINGPRTAAFRFAAAVAAVAAGTALFAVGFRALLGTVYQQLFHATNVVAAVTSLSPLARVATLLAGGFLAGAISLLRRSARQDVSNVMEAVALGRVRLSFRTTLRRVTSSWVAIASGMSIGREGPLIEFGGTLGAAIGRMSRLPLSGTRVLVAAGTAAGFAAAYNTPFAAVLFVLETVVGIAALEAVIPTICATVIASLIVRAVVGGGPLYGAHAFAVTSAWEYPLFLVLAIVGAGIAAGFRHALRLSERLFERIALPVPMRSAAGGLIVGGLAVLLPQVAGNGYEPLNQLLDGALAWRVAVALLVGKILATSASVGSGVPGGIFTPVLLVGGIGGALWGGLVSIYWSVPASHLGSYVLIGMAATTAASTHAPLTATVFVFEISGDYAIALPLLLVTSLATAVSRGWGAVSVYEAELRRRGLEWRLTLEGRAVNSAAPPAK
jgi:chloride channel protein, CIC family